MKNVLLCMHGCRLIITLLIIGHDIVGVVIVYHVVGGFYLQWRNINCSYSYPSLAFGIHNTYLFYLNFQPIP